MIAPRIPVAGDAQPLQSPTCGWNAIGSMHEAPAPVLARRQAWRPGAINRRTALLLLALSTTACGAAEPEQQGEPPLSYTAGQEGVNAQYEIMPAREMVPFRLERVRLIALGKTAAESPTSVARIKVGDTMIMLVDEAARRLRVYDRMGGPVANVAIDSSPLNDHKSPVGLASRGDTMFVLDLDQSRGITAYNGRGQRLVRQPTHVDAPTVDLALDGAVRIVAAIGKNEDIVNRRGAVLWSVTADGTTRPLGCLPDSLYRVSVEGGKFFQFFRFFGVSLGYGRVYCRQPITPVVQILGPDGHSMGVARRAPPFYKRPTDISQKQSDKQSVDNFRADWTEHARFFPQSAGFVSSYTTYDLKAGRDRYLLFSCDSAAGPAKCGTLELRGRPMDFLAPDTLVVVEPLERADDIQQIGLYLLRPKR